MGSDDEQQQQQKKKKKKRKKKSRGWHPVRWLRETPARWSANRHRGGFVAIRKGRVGHYVKLPRRIWSTKSHDWWVLLGAVLKRLEPRSILELGAGRSSIYLSEYACKEGRSIVSIDEDPQWVAVVQLIARFGGLRDDFAHHVPLGADGYYDVELVEKLITEPPDFVYLDGPIQTRSGLMNHPSLMELCANADVIVVDDIQWGHIYDYMDALQNAGKKRCRTVIEYTIPEDPYRFLGLLVRDDLQPIVDDLIRSLGIDTVEDYPRSRCVKE